MTRVQTLDSLDKPSHTANGAGQTMQRDNKAVAAFCYEQDL